MTEETLFNSSPAATGAEPGLVDSPPTSIISAPSSTILTALSTAQPASSYMPSPLNESGVRFKIPMTNVLEPNLK